MTTARAIPRETRMNKLEGRYYLYLMARQSRAEILKFEFEPEKFRLADNTFYTPDFRVVLPNGEIEFHEVKGFWRDDARIKFKVANEQHPMFRWIAITEDKRTGEFVFEVLK